VKLKSYIGAEEHVDDVGLSGGDCGVVRRMGRAGVWVRASKARLVGRPFTRLLEMVSPDLRKGGEMEENMQLDEPWAKLSILPPFSLPDLRNGYFNECGVF
jgi:hypothetical protein